MVACNSVLCCLYSYDVFGRAFSTSFACFQGVIGFGSEKVSIYIYTNRVSLEACLSVKKPLNSLVILVISLGLCLIQL